MRMKGEARPRYPGIGVHTCSITTPDCWPRLSPRADIIRRAWRAIRESAMPSYHHPDARHVFKSAYKLRQEKIRMIYNCCQLVIHPFSLLNLYLATLKFLFLNAYLTVETFRIYFFMHRKLDEVIIILKVIQLFAIPFRFITGYYEVRNDRKHIVLEVRKIAHKYLTTFFVIDCLDVLRVFVVLIHNDTVALWLHVVIFNAYFVVNLMTNSTAHLRLLLKIVIPSQQRYHALVFFVYHLILSIHYSTCFLHGMPFMLGIVYNQRRPTYEAMVTKSVRHKLIAYLTQLHTVMLYYFRANSYEIQSKIESIEMVEVIINLAMFFLGIYTFVFVLSATKSMNQSEIKYDFMWTNIYNFLQSRNITGKLRYKILAHYQNKFQHKFFDEAFIIANLSKHLQYENQLHVSSHIIQNVKILHGLPTNIVGRLISYLVPIVYQPNDIILNWQMPFDGIYFISYGTVAIFNTRGQEVMHLEDGSILGCMKYYMGSGLVTITAVTITEVYKLSHQDLEKLGKRSPELLERFLQMGKKMFAEILNLESSKATSLEPILKLVGQEGKKLRHSKVNADIRDLHSANE